MTYAAFFKRGHGFPRFRAVSRYHSATFRVGGGLTMKADGRIGVVGLPGSIKVKWHRSMPSDAKLGAAILTRQNGKWHIVFAIEAGFSMVGGVGDVGIDLGLNSLVALSDGQAVEAPRFARRAQASQRVKQRALARCRKGSRRRLKAKHRLAIGSAKIAKQRRDFAHKLSHALTTRYGRVAFENLNIQGLGRGMLAKSMHDAAWSQIIQFTTYKAANAGVDVVLVDPRHTSQTCPECGTIQAKQLSTRVHRCECGYIADRDVAAARIVLMRANFGPGTGLRAPSQRDAA